MPFSIPCQPNFRGFLHSWEETFINILNSIIQKGFWDKEEEKKNMSPQCLQHYGCDLALPVLFPSTLPHSPSLLQLSPACFSFFTVFKGNSGWSVQCAKAQRLQKRLSRAFKILIQIHCNAFAFHLSPSRFQFMMGIHIFPAYKKEFWRFNLTFRSFKLLCARSTVQGLHVSSIFFSTRDRVNGTRVIFVQTPYSDCLVSRLHVHLTCC